MTSVSSCRCSHHSHLLWWWWSSSSWLPPPLLQAMMIIWRLYMMCSIKSNSESMVIIIMLFTPVTITLKQRGSLTSLDFYNERKESEGEGRENFVLLFGVTCEKKVGRLRKTIMDTKVHNNPHRIVIISNIFEKAVLIFCVRICTSQHGFSLLAIIISNDMSNECQSI